MNICKSTATHNTHLFFLVLLIHYVLFIPVASEGVIFLVHDCPNYTWTELLINYEGGFVRRGLIGQLLLYLSYCIPLERIVPFFFFTAYILFAYYFLSSLFRRMNFATVLMVAISPGLLLFPVYDIAVFGRKDIIIVMCIIAMMDICTTFFSKKTGTIIASICFTVIYSIGFLAHEIIVLFFPLPAILLLCVYANHNKIKTGLLLIGSIFTLSVFLSFLLSSSPNINEMISSWEHTGIRLKADEGAYKYLDFSFRQGVSMTLACIGTKAGALSVFVAFVLSSLPFFLHVIIDTPIKKLDSILKDMAIVATTRRFFIYFLYLFLFAPFFAFILVADAGRVIYFLSVFYLYFFSCLSSIRPSSMCNHSRFSFSTTNAVCILIFIVIYATSWRLEHVVVRGDSFLRASGLSKLLLAVF